MRMTWRMGAVGVFTGVVLAACSSGSSGTSHSSSGGGTATPPPPTTSASTAQAPTTTAPVTKVAAAGLSGTWSGQYSGAFSGTFKLTWQQTGSKLHGSITLSTPASRETLNGTVTGGAIKFGTVGSTAITYSGTVSGSSMSGSYQVQGMGSGSWSATKS